ncbi:MAG: sulfatase-like hydrolase/transferase [Acidobacteriia bacterium]|nr:sulfatase-like hydrolase/transferase [Terriglobia bacterium]
MLPKLQFTRRQVLAAGTAAPLVLSAQPGNRPNIVFILADDLGYADLSCYGRREYRTPNIDRIAAAGLRFTQAYANSAVCSATRTALITGRYQYRLPVGLEEPLTALSRQRHVGLPPSHPTLPSLLRKAGYGTTLLGKWHLGWLPDYSPLKSGYDHFWGFRGGALDYFTHKSGPANTDTADLWEDDAPVEKTGYLTDLLAERAVSVIRDSVPTRRPFFLSLHFNAPHWPWEGPGDEAESRRVTNLMDFDGGSLATYGRMVGQLDRAVGRVLDTLESTGVADTTIVVFTSDNGGERFSDTWPFTGKKTDLLEGGLRIPALMRWPGHIQAGSQTDQVAITMDWLPTLVAAAGAQPDSAYPSDGINLLPVLAPNAARVSRKLFWRYKYNSQRAMRDGNWKWLKIQENTFLFDVVADPLERANMKYREAGVYRRLVTEYEAWNGTMLPEDPRSSTAPLGTGKQLADHYGVRPK